MILCHGWIHGQQPTGGNVRVRLDKIVAAVPRENGVFLAVGVNDAGDLQGFLVVGTMEEFDLLAETPSLDTIRTRAVAMVGAPKDASVMVWSRADGMVAVHVVAWGRTTAGVAQRTAWRAPTNPPTRSVVEALAALEGAAAPRVTIDTVDPVLSSSKPPRAPTRWAPKPPDAGEH